MKKTSVNRNSQNNSDIPKNIVVLVLMIAIIVSVTGTWMVLDAISGVSTSTGLANRIIQANHEGNIQLNIEYDEPINITQEPE